MKHGRCIDEDDTIYWFDNNERHRLDGPAVEYAYGHRYWYQHGRLHRRDGPALDFVGGTQLWYINDKKHRVGGPAVNHPNGYCEWWYNNTRETREKNCARERRRIASGLTNIQICLPVESYGLKFPLVDLILGYSL
jgi:hypothetical protein